MAITASSILPNNSLEEFRVEFNNLVTDVEGVAGGNTFTSTIVFEGATADAYETTVLATDPTADRTITLPNVTGTVLTSGNSDLGTTTTNSGDADFVLVDDGGVLKKITASNLGVGTPSTITLAATNSTDATHYPMFSSAATGAEEPRTDTGLTYNPSSGILTTAAVTTTAAIIVGTTVSIIDDQKLILGSNSDISLRYDETTTDSLIISSDVNDAALGIILQSDAGADAGDEWKLNIANGGTLTLANDIASAGTHVTLLTVTPNSTAASSTHAFIGILSASGGLKVADGGNIGSATDGDAMAISSGGVVSFSQSISLVDDKEIVLGTNSDISIKYDETTTDSLVISSDVNDAALNIVLQADDGADAGDEWKLSVANGGVMTLGNDKNSAGTHVTHLTITPHATAASATMAFTGSITTAGNAVKTVGTETIWVPASAMYPCTTNPCSDLTQVETTAQQPEMKVLDFDTSSDEFAQFTVAFPKSWNAGTVTFRAFWFGLAATTGVAWALQGRSVADNAESVGAFGTAVVVQDDSQGDATEVLVSGTSSAITIAGVADDTLTFFQIYRDVSDGNDDMAGDARLAGIQIFYTTNAANDA